MLVVSLILNQASMEGRERVMRERKLYDASLSGNVESLNQLVKEDVLILVRVSLTCFNETPLHIAAMLGHVDFAKTLLSLKPDLVNDLDSQRRSPLHLASANGYVEIVKILLMVDSSVCLVRDEDRRTPLHLAAMKGRVDVVSELARVRQDVITQYTLDRGETILHLCVMHNRLEALKLLIELITFDDFVNVKDENGNTILHTATALKQMQTIKYLLSITGVRVNVVNGNGFTALDIIDHTPKDLKAMEIRELLIASRALRASDIPASSARHKVNHRSEGDGIDISGALPVYHQTATPTDAVPRPTSSGSGMRKIFGFLIKKKDKKEKKEDTNLLEKTQKRHDSLMVAATVIAAMAYQAGLNPPGGVWQESEEDDIIPHKVHHAGTSILGFYHPAFYLLFWVFNTASFIASLSTILLLISGFPLQKRFLRWLLMAAMWVTITFMTLTYLVSMFAITPPHGGIEISSVLVISMLAWLGLIALIFIVQTCRFIRWIVRKCRKRSGRNVN